MDDIQQQMNAILGNPEMMQKIMAMAQSLNQPQPTQQEPSQSQKEEIQNFSFPELDLSMVQRLSGIAGKSNIDKNQKSLLSALTPYLSKERISKLEKAMRAAKMANMASRLLGNSGFQFNSGR